MSRLVQDLRHAGRLLARGPGFTLTALATLALGIGANTLMFSIVDQTLIQEPPYPEPERLMVLEVTVERPGQPRNTLPWSYPKLVTLEEVDTAFERLAGVAELEMNLTGGEETARVSVEMVSAGYFPLLGVAAARGRTFSPAEDAEPGAHPVALLSHRLWQQRFGGDPEIVGATLSLEKRPLTVVGVLPPGFEGLTGGAELWVPMAMAGELYYPEVFEERWNHWLDVVGRLAPGVTPEGARESLAVTGRLVDEAHPVPFDDDGSWSADAVPLRTATTDRALATSVLVLLAAVGFVLLIACASIANLLLARATGRRREMAVRLALGGQRGRLVRQLLTESLLLSLAGGALGLLLPLWGLDALAVFAPAASADAPSLARHFLDLAAVELDWRVLGFNFALAALVGALFGLVPALAASRLELAEALRQGTACAGAGGFRRFLAPRNLLVAGQVAVALVLLVGAGLMLRTFARLAALDPGFEPAGVLTFRVDPPEGAYTPDQARDLYDEILQRLAALPGVEAASIDRCTPLSDACNVTLLTAIEGQPELALSARQETSAHFVGPDHFRALGVPLVAGRTFGRGDRAGAPLVVMVSETAARAFFGDGDALGQRIAIGMGPFRDGATAEVVGVVGDVQYGPVAAPPRPAVYLAARQYTRPTMTVLLRTSGDPLALAGPARQEIAAIDRDLAVFRLQSMEERTAEALSQPRFAASLLAAFAAVALGLAAMGIYGVMAYAVGQRTRELGVRVALGAGPGQLLRLVGAHGLAVVGAGLAAGLAGALALSRLLESLLYEVSATDPVTFALVVVLLGAVALAACYAPARRALRVDPVVVLKEE